MLFPFLNYVNPIWYFNLPVLGKHPYFVDYESLASSEKELIDWDGQYSDLNAAKRDAAYQMWHKGFIKGPQNALKLEPDAENLADNYRFIRRHFHPIWSYYILGLRIMGFHPLLAEWMAFRSQSKVKRLALYASVYPHEAGFVHFESPLLRLAPKVSVIIPTLNRYEHLANALHDLELQEYPNFEVIVIDQSRPFQADFYSKFKLKLQVKQQEAKALWKARNTAIKLADADFLLLFDDDSRVESDWISSHLKCLDYFQSDISAGVSISQVGDKVPENYRFFRWADQLDTGNVMIKRAVFEKIGLFDLQFEGQRMGDGAFGLRAYLAGFKSISNARAQRLHLKVPQGGLREMGSWDGFRPKSWFAPRPVPSVLYLFRSYFNTKTAILGALLGVLPSLVPYRFKRNRYLLFGGSLLAVLLLPLVFIQVMRSWQLASQKLKEGPILETLP
jgi:glycosyltransferase involved in cell wall biosynthesis